MKGILIKINDQWNVRWGLLHYPLYGSQDDDLKEGKEVDFEIKKFWETGIEKPFDIAVLLTPPYVSDDFQIGPDGAYEHTDDLDDLDDFHYHEVLDRLMLVNDILERHLVDHPVCEKHPELKLIIENAIDNLAEAYLKMEEIR